MARRLPMLDARRAGLLDELLRHRAADAEAYAARARALESPCFDGCSGCCHQLVLVEMPDALLIARHLLAENAATPALRALLAERAERAETLSPDDAFAAGIGCAFLDRNRVGGACTIYEVRPLDCGRWFIHGVPGGAACEPGAPDRPAAIVRDLAREAADVRYSARWLGRFFGGTTPSVWAPLPLAVLAALDYVETGAAGLAQWRDRLDAATRRSIELTGITPA